MSNVAMYFIVIYFIVMCVKVFCFVVVWFSWLITGYWHEAGLDESLKSLLTRTLSLATLRHGESFLAKAALNVENGFTEKIAIAPAYGP